MRVRSYDHPISIGQAEGTKRGPARKRGARPRSLGSLRLVELEKLLRHRGLQSAPADHLVVVVHHVLNEFPNPTSCEAIDAAREHLSVLARDLPLVEREAIIEGAAMTCRRWSARALGQALDLTNKERKALDIRTFKFAGQTRKEQREAKRTRDRAGAARRRRDRGATERCVYEAESVAEEARRSGVSRMTIYRRRRLAEADVTGASPIASLREASLHDEPVTPVEQVDVEVLGACMAAGPQAPARPETVAIPQVQALIVRVFMFAASARRLAEQVDDALRPALTAARRASRGLT